MKYLGFVLLVLSGYVMAEEVYYCIDNTNGVNGFKKIDGQYTSVNFKEDKFKMKLKDDGDIVIDNSRFKGAYDFYSCSMPYQKASEFFRAFETNTLNATSSAIEKYKSCEQKSDTGFHFNFNPDNGRYVLFKGSAYVFDNTENTEVVTRIGTCTKF